MQPGTPWTACAFPEKIMNRLSAQCKRFLVQAPAAFSLVRSMRTSLHGVGQPLRGEQCPGSGLGLELRLPAAQQS